MNFFKNRKIKYILIELIPYTILFILGYYLLSSAIYNQNILYLNTINKFKISNLKIFFEAIQSEAEILNKKRDLIIHIKQLKESLDDENKYNLNKELFESDLKQTDNEFAHTLVMFTDNKGKILYFNSGNAFLNQRLLGKNIESVANNLKKTFEKGLKTFSVDDYSYIKFTGNYYYKLSFPVVDENNLTQAVFIVLIPASRINAIINEPISSYKTIHSYLIGKNYVLGTVLNNKNSYLINKRHVLESFTRKDGTDNFIVKNYNDTKVVRSIDHFSYEGLKFTVATDIDYNEVYSPVYYYIIISLLFIFAIIALKFKMYGDQTKHLSIIQELQSRFESIFEGSAIGISILNLEGKYISVNPLALQALKTTPDKLKNISFKDITHPDYLDEAVEGFNNLINQKIAMWHAQQKLLLPYGEEAWVNINRYLIKNKDGSPLYVMSLAENITREKLQEQALTEKEYKYSQLFNHLTTCLVVFDVENEGRDFIIKDKNKMTECYDPEIIVGKNIFELSTFFKNSEIYKTLKNVWETEVAEVKNINVDNKWFDTCTFKLSANEIVILFNDITEKIKTEKLLHLTHKSIDNTDFATFWVAKDASIVQVNKKTCDQLGYTKEELLQLKVFDIDQIMKPAQWDEHFALIKAKHIHRFESLHKKKDGAIIQVEITTTVIIFDDKEYIFAYVNDITERKSLKKDQIEKFYTLETPVEDQTIQLRESIEKLEKENKDLKKQEKEITDLMNKLNYGMRSPLSAITGFTGLLLEEYYGFMNEKQSQTLKVIHDSGEELMRILNEVFNNEKSDEKPLQENDEIKLVITPPSQEADPEKPKKKILIAEDNAMNLQLVLDLLSIYNYEVIVARDGIEAIELAQSSKPDLILMDIKMPFMDGDEVTRKLRAMPEFSQTPIIALTAYAGKVAKSVCIEAGFTDYLDKPYPIQALLNILNVHLSIDLK